MSVHMHFSGRDQAWNDPIPDPGDGGAIPVLRSGACSLVSVGADETRTLAAPSFLGQQLLLCFKTDGGDIVLTCATTVNVSAHTTITFDTAGECILLVAVYSGSDLRWRALSCFPETDTPATA